MVWPFHCHLLHFSWISLNPTSTAPAEDAAFRIGLRWRTLALNLNNPRRRKRETESKLMAVLLLLALADGVDGNENRAWGAVTATALILARIFLGCLTLYLSISLTLLTSSPSPLVSLWSIHQIYHFPGFHTYNTFLLFSHFCEIELIASQWHIISLSIRRNKNSHLKSI